MISSKLSNYLTSATYLEQVLSLQAAVAEFAAEFESPQMHGQMLRQVRLLREALVAAGLLAYKGSLSRVHSKVVEEVVPLSEKHLAVTLIALKNLDLAHCARIFIPEHAEGACRGHRLLDLDRAEIEVSAELHMNLRALRDLLLHLCVGYVVAGEHLGHLAAVFRRNLV